jgi:hypothetical protein
MASNLSRRLALLLLLLLHLLVVGQLRVLQLQVPMLLLSCHLPIAPQKVAQQQQQLLLLSLQ